MKRRSLLCCLCALALAACASTSSNVLVQQGDTDPSKCRTFDWLPASKQAASLTEQSVRSAALAELQAKGYTLSRDKPDCRITYILTTYERPQPRPRVGVGAAGGSGGVRGGIGVSLPVGRRNGHAGTFTLDVVDVADNAQIWSGSVDASFAAAEPTADEVQALVRAILAQFPDRAAPPS